MNGIVSGQDSSPGLPVLVLLSAVYSVQLSYMTDQMLLSKIYQRKLSARIIEIVGTVLTIQAMCSRLDCWVLAWTLFHAVVKI